MTDRERYTILAALRALQSATGGPPYSRSELDQIATNDNTYTPLDAQEIDDLYAFIEATA